jgi:hypothetical protein
MCSELMASLEGQKLTDLILPPAGERPADYAARDTGELMDRSLALDPEHTGPFA